MASVLAIGCGASAEDDFADRGPSIYSVAKDRALQSGIIERDGGRMEIDPFIVVETGDDDFSEDIADDDISLDPPEQQISDGGVAPEQTTPEQTTPGDIIPEQITPDAGIDVEAEVDVEVDAGVETKMEAGVPRNNLPDLGDDVRRVFVTSGKYGSNMGGRSGAKDICQLVADGAGLDGEYEPWLSDTTGSPSTSFTRSELPYVRLDGAVVAENWDGLTAGEIQNPINVDENGMTIEAEEEPDCAEGGIDVWSGTDVDGTAFVDGTMSCGDWSGEITRVSSGHFALSSFQWSHFCVSSRCKESGHLYCVQQ